MASMLEQSAALWNEMIMQYIIVHLYKGAYFWGR